MAAERELRAALAVLPVIAFTATEDGRIDWVSDRWYETTGFPRDAVLGEAWAQLVHPDDIERVVWQWTLALEAGTPWEATARVRHADGSYRWWYTRAEHVGGAGQAYWVGTTIELTALPRHAIEEIAREGGASDVN